MNSNSIFEIFNHFVETRDPSQMLSLADNVEIFSSSTFGDGRTYIGEQAPAKFRDTISIAKVRRPKIYIDVKHAVISEEYSKFFLEISKGKKSSGSTLDIIVKQGKLTCFHEASAKV